MAVDAHGTQSGIGESDRTDEYFSLAAGDDAFYLQSRPVDDAELFLTGGVMSTRVSVAGHPVHPMLVSIPIGLWVFSLVCDFVFVASGDPRWEVTASFTLGGGIVGALLAAAPGLIDLLGLHDPRARRIGVFHMVLNLAIVAAQAGSFWLRMEEGGGDTLARGISIVAVAALIASGWLGGHLVHVLGVTQPQSGAEAARHDQLHPRT